MLKDIKYIHNFQALFTLSLGATCNVIEDLVKARIKSNEEKKNVSKADTRELIYFESFREISVLARTRA